MVYIKEITRRNPGCIMFLIDQSQSMSKPLAEVYATRSDVAAHIINEFIMETALNCTRAYGTRDYFYISIIGYRTDMEGNDIIGPVLGVPFQRRELIPISELTKNPLRFDKINISEVNFDTGEPEEIEKKIPIWYEPVVEGRAPLCSALRYARGVLEKWAVEHPDSFPPIVINITGGEYSDGDHADLVAEAHRLTEVATRYGNTLLFNIYLSEIPPHEIIFPSEANELPDEFARALFEASSIIPDPILKRLNWGEKVLSPGARGLLCNPTKTIFPLDIFFWRGSAAY